MRFIPLAPALFLNVPFPFWDSRRVATAAATLLPFLFTTLCYPSRFPNCFLGPATLHPLFDLLVVPHPQTPVKMTSRKRLQNNGESSQSSTHQLTTPKTSRWNAVNVPLQRRGTTSGINSRPSGIERPPFSIGPGESRGVICAVCHSNNVDRTVGLAFVNIPIAEAVLTTVADTQLYPQAIHKIQMMEASRVLMQPTPPSLAQSALSLRQHIGEELPCVPIVETPKSDWSEHVGMQCIRRVAFAADLPHLEFAVRDNSHALCAFAAVSSSGD